MTKETLYVCDICGKKTKHPLIEMKIDMPCKKYSGNVGIVGVGESVGTSYYDICDDCFSKHIRLEVRK